MQQRLGVASAAEIDWSNPRLVCVAQDFTRYDEHAVQQINRAIELVRYRDYDGQLLALELVTAESAALQQSIRAHAGSALAAYKVPRMLRFVDSLPRTTTGKLRRSAMRDRG